MRRNLRDFFIPFTIFVLFTSTALAQNWVQQPTALQSNPDTYVQVGGLWGIAVVDSGTGFAAGYASVTNGFSGVLRKTPGNPTWFVLPSSNFAGLATSHSMWSAVTAVGTSVWVCGSLGRLYKSTDNGNNWASSTTGIIGTNTLYDIFFKNSSEGMVVGNNGTIYYTSNGGSGWVQQTLPASVPATTPLYAVHSAGGNWYVSGGTHTLIRGTPQTSSTSWTDQTANVPSNLGLVEGLQFLDNNTGTIAGATVVGSPIYRTTDGGGSFTSIGSGLPTTAIYNTLYFFDQNYGWTGNAFQPLYETTDGGQNWTSHNTTTIGGSLSNLLTRIDFGGSNVGYASGRAPGTTSTGWILRYELPLTPDISLSATALDLDTLECAKTIDVPYYIRNRGTAPLDITMISFSSTQFTLAGGSLPSPIPAGGSATIHVRWTPTQSGPIPPGTTMTLASNDPQNPSWVVNLSGVYNKSRINISGSFAFPTTCLKDSSELSITVQYEGNLPPQVITFEHVSGDDEFTLVSPAVGSNRFGFAAICFPFQALFDGQ